MKIICNGYNEDQNKRVAARGVFLKMQLKSTIKSDN